MRARCASSCLGELQSELMGGSEKSVLNGAFGGVENRGYGFQSQALVVLELKDQALAGREGFEGPHDAFAQQASAEIAFGAGPDALIGDAVQELLFVALGRNRNAPMKAFLTQMV